MRRIAFLLFALSASCVYSCATNNEEGRTRIESTESGNVNLPLLTTTSDGRTFRLDNASFKFVGEITHTASAPSAAAALEVTLPVGTYTVELLDGWQLTEILPDDVARLVTATVSGPNPLPLAVTKAGTTEAVFQLQLVDSPSETGTGRVRFEVVTSTCKPKTVTECRLEKVDCGTMSDGCDGSVNCGTCPTGKTCDAGKCVCPLLKCTAELECGVVLDACGNSINCGLCSTGKTCIANHCEPEVCVPKTCAEQGISCGSATDGCGSTLACGTCDVGSKCNDVGLCVPECIPTKSCSDVECGSISDGCGKTLACGTCGEGKICNDENKCVIAPCKPKTCSELGVTCGTKDNDGCGGALDCGNCAAGQECSGGVCVCKPKTCTDLGALCGTASNGCGGTLDCGGCPVGSACNTANKCTCTPKTCASAGAVCGKLNDGCGGELSCGDCPSGNNCSAENKCVCAPTSCSASGTTCGTVSDGCGGTLTCGTCSSGSSCSSGKCVDSSVSGTFKFDSTWSSGYCGTITVTNNATTPTKGWTVLVDLHGATISSSWSSVRTATSTGMQFASATYNSVVATKATTSFGFCTTFSGTRVDPTVVSSVGTF